MTGHAWVSISSNHDAHIRGVTDEEDGGCTLSEEEEREGIVRYSRQEWSKDNKLMPKHSLDVTSKYPAMLSHKCGVWFTSGCGCTCLQ